MTTMRQRAAARRNIKKAIAANRRHGGKRKKSHRSRRSSRGSTPSKSPGLGSVYANASTGLKLLAPVTDEALLVAQGTFTPSAAIHDLGVRAGLGNYRTPYIEGAAVAIVDRAASQKFGQQAQALSRMSVSAWAPEIYAFAQVAAARGSGARGAHAAYVRSTTGFDPSGTFDWKAAAPYMGLKYGGIVARKAMTKFPVLGRPFKKALHAIGVTA